MFIFLCRKLTAKQKELMSSFAELDKDTEGTVYSSPKTKSGKSILNSNISAFAFIFRREIKRSRGIFSKAQTNNF